MTAQRSQAWRAHRFGEPRDVLLLEHVETPTVGTGDIRIRVAANGLNFLDASICRGDHPFKPALPFTPGAELVGTVEAIGEGVSTVAVGDRVIAISPSAHGCFAKNAVVSAVATYPVPASIPDEHAAALLVTYQTAYVALIRRALVREGEWVLVHAGAGGLGTALIQVARASGARVIATAGSAEKVAVCLEQGAEVAIVYRSEDFRPAVMEATGGRGADVICDQVGGDVFARSCECVAFEGRVLPLGWASGTPPTIEPSSVVGGNYSVVGVSWGSTYPRKREDVVREAHAKIVEMYLAGTIRPFVPQTWESAELPAALQLLADGKSVGKLVVRWDVR